MVVFPRSHDHNCQLRTNSYAAGIVPEGKYKVFAEIYNVVVTVRYR